MKILMLADKMDIGGAETHVYELSRSLFSMGHEVKIISDGGFTAELLKKEGLGFVSTSVFSKRHFSLFAATKKLLSVLREFKPDVVHAHTRRTLLVANAVRKAVPFALVFTAHAKFSATFSKRLLTKPPKHTIAVSEDIKAHFLSSFGAEKITVIENGIDTDRFSPSQSLHHRPRIVTVSRLDKDSSLSAELLCRIAPRLSKKFPDIEITVVGGGNDLQRIEELAQDVNRQLGRRAIHTVGAKTDVLPYLRSSSLFVGVSRAALEAMCVGMSIIICGNEGYFGILDSKNFDICARENFCARGYPLPDAETLYGDIVNALVQKNSLTLRHKVIARYDARVTSVKTLTVYRQALKGLRAELKYDVVLCGYYGFGNLGDEMVLSQIKKTLSQERVAVIGAGGDGRLGRLQIFSVIKAVRSSRVFVLGGGSLLQNSTSRRSLIYYLTILRTAAFFGKKIMLYANGLGPIQGEKAIKACRRALLHIDVASFRDKASFESSKFFLKESATSYLTCDPALLLATRQTKENRIAVFIRGEDANVELTKQLSVAFSKIRSEMPEDAKIVFASMNQKKDGETATRLAREMPFHAEYRHFSSCEEAVGFIASSVLIISGRLHALIVAAGAGRPFVALCHDPKLEAFAKDCEMPPILMPRVDDGDLGNKLCNAVKYASEHYGKLEDTVTKAVKNMTILSKRDTQEIKNLLK